MDGKKGFITGAGQGIGKALADGFAQVGAEFAVVGRHYEKVRIVAEDLSAKYGLNIIAIECEVSDSESVNNMITKVVETYGTIDFAINNVGIVCFDPIESVSPENFHEILDVNLFGLFLTAQGAIKVMIEKGVKGTIINTASMSGHIINTPQTTSSYCTSKAGVIHLTQSMAVEMAKYGIRVNCVSPGYISKEGPIRFPEQRQDWIDRTPQKRMAGPEELVGAYLYLASDASFYATGTEIIIDGGYTLI
jgi:NAD(P)-dependent dehydrogenase (short-subunit alcohol dehydrogenase family)